MSVERCSPGSPTEGVSSRVITQDGDGLHAQRISEENLPYTFPSKGDGFSALKRTSD